MPVEPVKAQKSLVAPKLSSSSTGELLYNLATRLRKARDLNAGLNRDYELARIGTLRAGSAGIRSPEGEIAGTCHRRSHLRSLGMIIEEEHDEQKFIVFDRGRDQEFSIINDLRSTLEENEVLLCEEEIPIVWLTSGGKKVTGRPDGVICSVEQFGLVKRPVLGIEVKSIGSIWTTRSVLLENRPPLKNLVQAGHYMWKLDVPYKLIYRQNSKLTIPKYPFLMNLIPSNPRDFRYDLIHRTKGGEPQEILPHTIVFDLRFHPTTGKLEYKYEGEPESTWTTTVVDIPSITSYYEYVGTLGEEVNGVVNQDLGPRPTNLLPNGESGGYIECDYCPLKPVCKASEKLGYTKWLEAVRQRTTYKQE